MRKALPAVLLSVCLFAILLSQSTATASSAGNLPAAIPSPQATDAAPEFVANEIVVRLRTQIALSYTPTGRSVTDAEFLNTLIDRYGVTEFVPVFKEAQKPSSNAQLMANLGMGTVPDLTMIYTLHLPNGSDIPAIITALESDPNIEYAEPNYIAQATFVPNDPHYADQWGLLVACLPPGM